MWQPESVDDQQIVSPLPGFHHLTFEEFQRLFGPWAPYEPPALADLLAGAAFRWWIGGGWAVEAVTGTRREHEDIDVVVLRRDLPQVRRHLDRFHLWSAHGGTLAPLLNGTDLPLDHEQLWVRRNAYSPWVMDVLLTPAEGEDWIYKHDHRLRRPLAEVGFVGPDGLPYLRPEVVLLFKARLSRAKDSADFDALLRSLGAEAKSWLATALELTERGHPWIERLQSPAARPSD
jgi:hypothetical protein